MALTERLRKTRTEIAAEYREARTSEGSRTLSRGWSGCTECTAGGCPSCDQPINFGLTLRGMVTLT